MVTWTPKYWRFFWHAIQGPLMYGHSWVLRLGFDQQNWGENQHAILDGPFHASEVRSFDILFPSILHMTKTWWNMPSWLSVSWEAHLSSPACFYWKATVGYLQTFAGSIPYFDIGKPIFHDFPTFQVPRPSGIQQFANWKPWWVSSSLCNKLPEGLQKSIAYQSPCVDAAWFFLPPPIELPDLRWSFRSFAVLLKWTRETSNRSSNETGGSLQGAGYNWLTCWFLWVLSQFWTR